MRVVAGELRSRKLHAAPGRDTRPTSDRARAGLFDWLGSDVQGDVLDLYAGTGALGIEAISRGCHFAVFVERARAALAALHRNIGDLDLEPRSRVLALDVRRALAQLVSEGARFDLVLADPPYGREWERGPAAAPEIAALLADDGVLIVERSTRDPRSEAAGLVYRDSRSYGETAFDRFDAPGTGDR